MSKIFLFYAITAAVLPGEVIIINILASLVVMKFERAVPILVKNPLYGDRL